MRPFSYRGRGARARTDEHAHEVGVRARKHVHGQLGRQVARERRQEAGLERGGRAAAGHGLADRAEVALGGRADGHVAAGRRLRARAGSA